MWDEPRQLPPLDLLAAVWQATMTRFYAQRELAERSTARYSPTAQQRLQQDYASSRLYYVYPAAPGIGSVRHPEGIVHRVDVSIRSCSCLMFQERAMPCAHVFALLLHQGTDPYSYIDQAYTIEAYRTQYAVPLLPILTSELEQSSGCDAPAHVTQRGRPPKKRRRRAHEGNTQGSTTCGHCGQAGHNRRTCRNAPVSTSA